jgi:hypothetical protein
MEPSKDAKPKSETIPIILGDIYIHLNALEEHSQTLRNHLEGPAPQAATDVPSPMDHISKLRVIRNRLVTLRDEFADSLRLFEE